MTYEVIRTIGKRQYRYRQRSYREGGKVRTERQYLGPVDGGVRKKQFEGGVLGLIEEVIDLARIKDYEAETDEQAQTRVADENAVRAAQERINDLLTGASISLDGFTRWWRRRRRSTRGRCGLRGLARLPMLRSEPSQPSEQSGNDDTSGSEGSAGPSGTK